MQRFVLRFTVIIAFLALTAVAPQVYAQSAAEQERAIQIFDQGIEKYSKGQYDAAIADFLSYLKFRSNDPSGWYNLALARYYRTQASPNEAGYRQAAADVSQAIKLDAKQADYWHVRGGIYSQLMMVDFEASKDRAIADFTEAIRLDAKYAPAYRERGVVYERVGRYREALADLNTAIRLDPQNATAHYTRAKVHGAQKNYASARRDAETAIRLLPNYDVAKIYLDFINNEERKATAVSQKPQPARTAPARPQPTPAAARGTPSSITDVNEAFQQAAAAEKARDHRKTVAYSARALQLIPMKGPTETRDDLMLSVFISTLEMRARASSALGDHSASDADYEMVAKASMNATDRYIRASTDALDNDKSASGAGLIMSSLKTAQAVIYCTSGYETTKEWFDTVKRLRPNDSMQAIKAGINLMGIREICVNAHILHAGDQAASSILGVNSQSETYAKALSTLQKAIAMMPNNEDIYKERAKIHRRFSRADLAAADEKKVRELEAAKSSP
ncbi:MAG: tetratricopeptide repeat protein [Pyrinomonadaceae bacterium]|nr:tetratricopeptide repeat protein [Pyrinomonadaceae bacterium]